MEQPQTQITSLQRLLLLNQLSQLNMVVAAFMKVLSDRDKPVYTNQITDVMMTISYTLDTILNP